jgi:hypothetical protein
MAATKQEDLTFCNRLIICLPLLSLSLVYGGWTTVNCYRMCNDMGYAPFTENGMNKYYLLGFIATRTVSIPFELLVY